jgi:hypothetical protein
LILTISAPIFAPGEQETQLSVKYRGFLEQDGSKTGTFLVAALLRWGTFLEKKLASEIDWKRFLAIYLRVSFRSDLDLHGLYSRESAVKSQTSIGDLREQQ